MLSSMCHRIHWFAAVFIGSVLANVADAGIIAGFDSSRHSRFQSDGSNNSEFFLDHTQLTGVARQRAVLISPRHYISADHVSVSSATFIGLDGVERTYTASSSQTLLTNVPEEGWVGSDIRVYRLDEEVDASIRPLPIIVGSAEAIIGRELIAFDQNEYAGRNVIDDLGIVEFSSGSGDSVAIQFSYDTATNGGSGGLGADEIGLLSGDSGGTALMSVDGDYGVIGAHMGIDVPTGSSASAGDRYDSFSTVLAAYQGQLSGILASDGYQLMTLQVTAIPEPSVAAALGFGVMAITYRRRRSS
ncbi:PEP-CTERM sorting domain-containing protein [Roseiconus lacunae]|uniref:PEP-CTERM sorting domain-containing protein n=2 Tax=Roseiconus lacunae TaxID=2605694 RepID=UPI0011F24F63|nr:PEP-CTERM sorting domain-containing protein [Roseiconus lacunae]